MGPKTSVPDWPPDVWRTRRCTRRSPIGCSRRCKTRSEEHTSELQSQFHLVCRLLLEKKKHTGKDVNSHTVLDVIITTIIATIQSINIIGSREGSRNRIKLKANKTKKKLRFGIKSKIS